MILARSPFSLLPRLKIVSKRFLLGPFVWMLCGNSSSSSITASLQNVLAIGGAHADAESVRLAAFSIIGLECALHSWSYSKKFERDSVPGQMALVTVSMSLGVLTSRFPCSFAVARKLFANRYLSLHKRCESLRLSLQGRKIVRIQASQ